jgi:Pretoxin HINT domain/A nuclease of the HNH/ENDO VII superfamily with conserved WHH
VTEWFQRETSAIIDIFIGIEKISCTTDHPFWVQGQGWVSAFQLKGGMALQNREGEPQVIDVVRRRDEVAQVFNVEIEGQHTYFVSDLEILSHNMCGDPVRPVDSPNYEVGYEAKLERGTNYPGRSDRHHFQEANKQLHEAMKSDPKFAHELEKLYPGVTQGIQPGPRGAYPRSAPTSETTWHHEASREGTMQLVPRSQHEASGPVQQSLHPGGRGGMENWGGGR